MDKGFHMMVGICVQLCGVALMYWYSLYPVILSGSFVSLLAIIVLGFGLRYPHEFAHWLAGKAMRIDSVINFRRLNATCTPTRDMSAKELIVFALAPFVLLGIPLAVLSVVPMTTGLTFVCRGVFIYHVFACYFDFVYIFYALKYRRCRFVDHGLGLEVLQ